MAKKKLRKWKDIRRSSAKRVLEIQTELLEEKLEMSLKQIRELVGLTQVQLAERLGKKQPEISLMEGREDHLISTLKEVIAELGGELEVSARFGDKRVLLREVSSGKGDVPTRMGELEMQEA